MGRTMGDHDEAIYRRQLGGDLYALERAAICVNTRAAWSELDAERAHSAKLAERVKELERERDEARQLAGTMSGLRDEMLAYEARQKEQQQGPWKTEEPLCLLVWDSRDHLKRYQFATKTEAIAVRDALNETWRKEQGHA